MADRLADTQRFYDLLARLEARICGKRKLADCNGRRMKWPELGVYFFCEDGEERSGSGAGCRIVRVGTHGLKAESRSTLWQRLSQHRGAASSCNGNHRGSIFRGLVGRALAQQGGIDLPPSWKRPGKAAKRRGLDRVGVKGRSPRGLTETELEARVSCHIRAMPFLWLNVGDERGPGSDRGKIERNAIALLSGYRKALDQPSPGWLGRSSDDCRVRRSGLWNSKHVDEDYCPSFLDDMERLIEAPQLAARRCGVCEDQLDRVLGATARPDAGGDPDMTDDDARGRQNFTLRGRELSIAPADICTATRDVPPTTPIDGRYKYFVELHGRRFPIKQVLQLVMSRPWGFGAQDAHRILSKLGFDIIEDHGSGRRRRGARGSGAAARRS